MRFDLTSWGPVTVLLVAIAAIVALAGAAVCVIHPDTLTFQQFLDILWKFAIALAGLGIGRGIHLGGKAAAGLAPDGDKVIRDVIAKTEADRSGLADLPGTEPSAIPPDEGDGTVAERG